MQWLRRVYGKFKGHYAASTEVVVGFVALFTGLVAFFSSAGLPDSSFLFLDPHVVTAVLATVLVSSGLALLIGLMYLDVAWSKVIRRLGSFFAFLSFFYIGFLGLVNDGDTIPATVAISALGMAVLSGIIHINENKRKIDE